MTPYNAAIDAQADRARRAVRGKEALAASGFSSETMQQQSMSLSAWSAGGTTSPFYHAAVSLNTAATHTLLTGSSGYRIEVYEVFLWSAGAQNLQLYNGSTSLTGPINGFPAGSGIYLPNTGEPHFELDAGAPLKLSMSAAAQLSGFIRYRLVTA